MSKKGAQPKPLLMFMLALFLLPHFSLSHSDEVELLLSFKSSINDPLGFLSNWNSSVPLCLWHGITCNNFSYVKAIQLSNKKITGTISPSIFHLSNVETINLWHNQLSGEIPPDMVSSASLRYLNLRRNNFGGPIPNCSTSLQTLDLSFNMLSGEIPSRIGVCSSLQTLALRANNLEGEIPEGLGDLISLIHLDLSRNNLNGRIPSSLGNLHNLQYLSLLGNKLTGLLPTSLSRLQNLTKLDLGQNSLSGQIPELLAYLPHLQVLSLAENKLSGEIPKSLGRQSNLMSLYLPWNNLTGKIPDQLCHSGHLILLALSFNSLEGQIPRSLSTCKSLKYLYLGGNRLSGLGNDKGIVELDMFSDLRNLTYLDLSDNNLSLRSSINFNYTWTNLQQLYLSSCNVKEFPTFLKASKSLIVLELSYNKIDQIPKWMLKVGQDTLQYLNLSYNFLTHIDQLPWKNMITLDLDSNLIQGALPILPLSVSFFSISKNSLAGEVSALICNLSSFEFLNLSHNNLNGTIPQCLANFSKHLSVLDLGKNRFHGTIPKRFDNDCGLTNLNFNGNELEGSLPPSMANCRDMEVLDLGNNKINDAFPQWLETLPKLQVLVLRSNKFHGFLNPKISHSFPELRILDLSNNYFIGPLPKVYIENMKAMQNLNGERTSSYMEVQPNFAFGQYYSVSNLTVKGFEMGFGKILTTFTSIDLSNNNFHGEIPSAFGKLRSLRGLNLSHNSLSGYIPASMGNMTNLEWLDLSSNILIGRIPDELTALTFLSILNLSHNQLTGPIPQGKQFNTFENDSYQGNLGLCGLPLSKACKDDGIINQSSKEDIDESETKINFGWKVVAIGYGCGVIFGVVAGYLTFRNSEPKWFKTLYHHGHINGRQEDARGVVNADKFGRFSIIKYYVFLCGC